MKIIACAAAYSGGGGLGQHFTQLVNEARSENRLHSYYATGMPSGDPKGHHVSTQVAEWIRQYTPVRFSPSWSNHVSNEVFDWQVARDLRQRHDGSAEAFVGFVGKSLRSFEAARESGVRRLELVAANSHVNNLWRLHKRAHRDLAVSDSWLNAAQRRKTLREYALADVIHVHSEYVRQSFLDEGVPASKLHRMTLDVKSRFHPPSERPDDDVFRVVYVGRVDGTKGLPLLLEAFSRLSTPHAELTLVGGWSTRSMRKYMQEWLARDDRIRMAPGDPLPALHRADVFVHPTYEDGFGYAPVEALACDVPVIVTEDTGMKEYVEEGVNGYVVPTGSWPALLERMEHVRRHPLLVAS